MEPEVRVIPCVAMAPRRFALLLAASAALLAAPPPGRAAPETGYRVAAVRPSGVVEGGCRGADGKPLAGCLVGLRSVPEGKPWPAAWQAPDRRALLTFDLQGFRPALQWVPVGTQLMLWNDDIDSKCSVRGLVGTSRSVQFNFGVEPKRLMADVADAWLERPGPCLVRDDCRRGHHAVVWVAEHPYHVGPTQEDGAFRLDGVPHGTHTLFAWRSAGAADADEALEAQRAVEVGAEGVRVELVLRGR
jgi:hypothetical protein